ncbi:MAG: type II toxin-antitoxin system VapC family toxin [Chromatiaceae bacterium]|nr:type II toxin-antitoxin system VapC family toxin [Chromatiaceae bacterium]MCP5444633.1 type II toxin-antitoxin system VapC family toxin [Chromatiaceae bacterium]
MIGVDTNIIVRLLTRDDDTQFQKALKLFQQENIFITKTVFLETEWVLRYAYDFTPVQIVDALEKLAGLSQVTTESAFQVAQALAWFRGGLDFADALHLAGTAGQVSCFATFDRKLAKNADNADCRVTLL